MISQDKFILSKIKELEARLVSLESFNQLRGIIIKDSGGTNRIQLSGEGIFKISESGYDVLTAPDARLLFKIGNTIHIKLGEFAYALHSGPRQWTTNNVWTNINSSEFEVDGDSYVFTTVYFSVLGCVEVNGRIASYRIYNITNGVAVPNSEISANAVSSEAEGWANAATILSPAITLASGTKRYRLQFKQNVAGGAGDAVQFFKGELFYAQI